MGRGSQDGEKAKAKAFSLRFIVMSPNAREVSSIRFPKWLCIVHHKACSHLRCASVGGASLAWPC